MGFNLAPVIYWSGQRAYSNLLIGSSWGFVQKTATGTQNTAVPDGRISDDGSTIIRLEPGDIAKRIITAPDGVYLNGSAQVKCTFSGTGKARVRLGPISNVTQIPNGVTFTWTRPAGWTPSATVGNPWLEVYASDSSDPVRNMDCRETDADPNSLFAPRFLAEVSKNKVVRFMDWQKTNGSKPVSWTSRSTPQTRFVQATDGIAIEDMVELANQADVDPWFNLSWRADEEYVRKFAEYVRDNLSPSRKVYIEMSNEVWNSMFIAAKLAKEEGLAEGLDTKAFNAQMKRYAEKSTWAMKIWTDVFKGQSHRLVRVIASQNGNPWVSKTILSFRDTAQYADALAVAPYFGNNLLKKTTETNLDVLFAQLSTSIDESFQKTKGHQVYAKEYNLRFIGYEGGQHLLPGTDANLHKVMNRDSRMGDMYAKYLEGWRDNFGDVLVLFNDTGRWTVYGAWGAREYMGQPFSEAPKAFAIDKFAKQLP